MHDLDARTPPRAGSGAHRTGRYNDSNSAWRRAGQVEAPCDEAFLRGLPAVICTSDEADARWMHDDLPRLGRDDLEHELARVLHALALVDKYDLHRPWLLGRLRRVRQELRARP